jgi:hypothetical protein
MPDFGAARVPVGGGFPSHSEALASVLGADRALPSRWLAGSDNLGWRSMLARTYHDPSVADEFETAPTASLLVVVVTKGTYAIEARSGTQRRLPPARVARPAGCRRPLRHRCRLRRRAGRGTASCQPVRRFMAHALITHLLYAVQSRRLDDPRTMLGAAQFSPPTVASTAAHRASTAAPWVRSRSGQTGGVPWVWKDSMVLRPQAWPLARSAWFQVMGRQSGARTRRVKGLHSSTRLPPGS